MTIEEHRKRLDYLHAHADAVAENGGRVTISDVNEVIGDFARCLIDLEFEHKRAENWKEAYHRVTEAKS